MLVDKWPDDAAKRWPHFKASEMSCRCNCGALPDPAFMDWLEHVRGAFGHAMVITSGARCEKHNAAVGGAAESAHKLGLAVDVAVSGERAMKLIGASILWGVKGLGLKQHGGAHMVHLDLGPRETWTCWTYP